MSFSISNEINKMSDDICVEIHKFHIDKVVRNHPSAFYNAKKGIGKLKVKIDRKIRWYDIVNKYFIFVGFITIALPILSVLFLIKP